MRNVFVFLTLVTCSFLAYSQGTQVGESNSSNYHYNGNVGVGATSPLEKLQVEGLINADGIYHTNGTFNYENKTIQHYRLTLWALTLEGK